MTSPRPRGLWKASKSGSRSRSWTAPTLQAPPSSGCIHPLVDIRRGRRAAEAMHAAVLEQQPAEAQQIRADNQRYFAEHREQMRRICEDISPHASLRSESTFEAGV
ncbi:hypothetical protein CALVIDRAFT_541089 [Calocera viscosa TUFC12733]|uniref:Uncharacterized protein n=1 Tax=Calocera viscosa (strain TUFC12733) TaxID=1330018 RepID=A0A167I3Q9_CALVF|nr:hypothetical protein CALVIDRAFT_541089 [Calocera viscosa TUFC12733]